MSGLNDMKTRVQWLGRTVDDRFIKNKYDSFRSALRNSYQREWITTEDDKKWLCLINSNKLTDEYDKKVLSIDFKSRVKEGSVIYWNLTRTHWIVLLQELTEKAYFKGEIRRCNYKINDKWWVYLRGPVETALIWNQKHNLSVNDMNYSMTLYVTKNEETLSYFSRFSIIEIDGHRWRVAATDKYSQPGIIEMTLEEYFDNPDEEDIIKPEPVEPPEDPTELFIDGPQVVKVYDSDLYYSINLPYSNGTFVVDTNKVDITYNDSKQCLITIKSSKYLEFNLKYVVEDEILTSLKITVESL